jgi:hypothetical protein
MALVHHVLVWISANGYQNAKGKYLVLGDDFITVDGELYRNYCQLLDSLEIGYTASSSKNTFEFAKRYFNCGIEVTGLYNKAFLTAFPQPLAIGQYFRDLSLRGFANKDLTDLAIPLFVSGKRELRRVLGLVEVPFGSNITPESVAKWVLGLNGRGACNLGRADECFQSALKPFYQAAAVILSSQLSSVVRGSQQRAKDFASDWDTNQFIGRVPELRDPKNSFCKGIILAELQESFSLETRELEKNWKLMYMGEHMSLKTLLHPTVPDILWLDLKRQDKAREVQRVRLKHLHSLIKLMLNR